MAINWRFISDIAGKQHLAGFTPAHVSSMSGVTIAAGVDLGQMSRLHLNDLNISGHLKNILAPYVELKGQSAVDFLAAHPLMISQADADSLDKAVLTTTVSQLKESYNNTVDRSHDF